MAISADVIGLFCAIGTFVVVMICFMLCIVSRRRQTRREAAARLKHSLIEFDNLDVESFEHTEWRTHLKTSSEDPNPPIIRAYTRQCTQSPAQIARRAHIEPIVPRSKEVSGAPASMLYATVTHQSFPNPTSQGSTERPPHPALDSNLAHPSSTLNHAAAVLELPQLSSRSSFLSHPRPLKSSSTHRSRDMRSALLTRLASVRSGKWQRIPIKPMEEGEESPLSCYSQLSAAHSVYCSRRPDNKNNVDPPPVPTIPTPFRTSMPEAHLATPANIKPISGPTTPVIEKPSNDRIHLRDSVAFQFPAVPAQQEHLRSNSPTSDTSPVMLYSCATPRSSQYSPNTGQGLDASQQSESHWRGMRIALLNAIQGSESYSLLPTPQYEWVGH